MDYLSFYAETDIHVGVGQEMGPVDLPIHRERHTGIPFVPGHGLKGALRALAERNACSDDAKREVLRIFGPAPQGNLSQGDLIVHEALPLAVPFRSLETLFVRATCPLLLARFQTRTGVPLEWNRPAVGELLLPCEPGTTPGAAATDRKEITIEDVVFSVRAERHGMDLATLVHMPPGRPTATDLGGLVVLADTDFVHLVTHCLPVVARVQLSAAKTTDKWTDAGGQEQEGGNLWTEEALPADTILYAPVDVVRRPAADAARGVSRDTLRDLRMLLAIDESSDPKPIQLGGNETVGLGWCWMRYHPLAFGS